MKNTEHKFITIGEIMLRLTPPDYEKIRTATTFEARYGGSEANVALSLANLGIDSTFCTVVPDNSLGKSAVRMMRSNDVNCDPVIYSTPKKHRHTVLEHIISKQDMESDQARLFTIESTAHSVNTISEKQILKKY